MAVKTFYLDKENRYLHIPINDKLSDYDYWFINVYFNKEHEHEFFFGITPYEPDFWVPYYIRPENGDAVTLMCYDNNAPDNLFDGIRVGGPVENHPDLYPNLYREEQRAQVHFSPARGWMNDPNGLVYYKNQYHMCFQHNPFGQNHGHINVGWGLALSDDGVHFREYPDAIMPWDSMTHVASGSAIIDEDNVLGKGKDTLIAAFTGLRSAELKGRKNDAIGTRGQYLYYSTDGGFTFKPVYKYPVISVDQGENWRDPKILRLDDGSFCICVYEIHDGHHGISFYASKDLKSFEKKSFIYDFYECPDLFPLICKETGEKMWILYGGNGMYLVGDFVDYKFLHLYGDGYLDYGTAVYAGQTFNNTPGLEERFHIAWFRDRQMTFDYEENQPHGIGFSQCMSLMCKFTLHKTENNGYKLFREPVDSFYSLREGTPKLSVLKDGETYKVTSPSEINIKIHGKKDFRLDINGSGITFTAENDLIYPDNERTQSISMPYDDVSVKIVTDTRTVEMFINNEFSCSFSVIEKEKTLKISGNDIIADIEDYSLKSIWS